MPPPGTHPNTAVIAAGALVFRKNPKHKKRRQVLLVHRPKYDDWSFPKGKLDPGEHVIETATREVLEETGVEIRLGRPLKRQVYSISNGREKNVHYWVGHVVGDADVSGYEANAEIDKVRWVDVEQAATKLSHPLDVDQLKEAMEEPRGTRTLLVVRHGRAVKRAHWMKADPKRPLTDVGRQQARALVPVLHSFGIARVVTSPSTRCAKTLKPYADAQVLPLEQWPGLSEEEFEAGDLTRIAGELLASKEPIAVCSHRPVLPGLLKALEISEEPLDPGEFVAIHHRKGRIVGVERHLVR